MDNFDWRLTGQERYLTGVTLYRRPWRQPKPDWDHDHCEFCGATFASDAVPETLREGWATDDEYRWICEGCFADFRDRFGWQVG